MSSRQPSLAAFTALALGAALLGGCATPPPARDYSAFLKARPATLLVLPPVTLVDETFHQNGVFTANDAPDILPANLREFFGADVALYIKVKEYGTTYAVIASETRVEVEGRVIDLRSGELLWQGKAAASSAEQQQNQGGLAGLLISALINQVVGTTTDAAYRWGGLANARLLSAPVYNGILRGPRSPMAGKPPTGPGGQ